MTVTQVKKVHGSSFFPNVFVLMSLLSVSIIFPKENKGLNLRGIASEEDLKLTNAIIALYYLRFNNSVVLRAVASSRNTASQGKGQSKGRNEVLHDEANEWFESSEGRLLSIYLPRLNSGV